VKKILEVLKNLLKRKLLFIVLSGSLATIVIIFLVLSLINNESVIHPDKQKDITAQALTISIPEGAFNKMKVLQIRKISPENLPGKLSSSFVSDVYDVSPGDGIDEFAMKPLTIKYRIPKNLYLGEEYANLKVAYVPDIEEPVYRTLGGAYIDIDNNGPYIEVEAFHASKIGIIASVPEKQKTGLQLIKENSKSLEPILLLIPDIDRGFLGFIPNSARANVNIWSEIFPNRTVMYYEYPIVNTKSKSYMDSYRQFSRVKGTNSFILYEAEKLATELQRLKNLEFDIVAHGMGGIIARLAVEKHPEIKNVRKIVLISTPNKGTNIVNPIYFGTLLFGKPSEVIASNFSMDRTIVDSIKSHLLFYLESLGPLYREISVSSTLLSSLSETRKDIAYLCVVGNSPPMSIDVKSTPFESFYPELVKGSADGVVTKSSALIDGVESLVVEGSFFDCYISIQFQEKLRAFLAYEPAKVPEYKTETYPEKIPNIQGREIVSVKNVDISTPDTFSIAPVMKKTKNMPFDGVIDILKVGSQVIYLRRDGIYSTNGKLYEGNVIFPHATNSKMSFYANGNVMSYDGKTFSKLATLQLPANCIDLISTDFGIFSLVKNEKLILYRWEEKWAKMLELDGEYGKFLNNQNVILLTNNNIYELSSNGLKMLLSSSEINNQKISTDFTTFLSIENNAFVGLRSYALMVYDMVNRKYALVAQGWIDPEFLCQSGEYLLICGRSSIMFLNPKTMTLRKEIQKFDGNITRALTLGKEVYVLVDGRVEVYELP
jgi:hypothetical protein